MLRLRKVNFWIGLQKVHNVLNISLLLLLLLLLSLLLLVAGWRLVESHISR